MRFATAAHHSAVAAQEAPEVVAVFAVPLRPAEPGEVADLVQTGGIPGLGDDLGVGQRLRQLDLPDHRRIGHDLAVLAARENRALVESETVDVHLANPVLQALDDQLLGDRVVAVQRVPAPRVVHVVLPVIQRPVW